MKQRVRSNRKQAEKRVHSGPLGQVLPSFFSFFAFLLLSPVVAFAAVEITEIMYDIPGSDSGREWIEVTNTGVAAINIAEYRFFEADTNHKLKNSRGATTLAPGASAIIADNAAKFLIDWPAYIGILFESAFSLSNTGEALAIKNSKLGLEDSVSYTSTIGAAGDSGSLQKRGTSFVPGIPTPGLVSSEVVPVPKKQVPVSSQPKQTAKAKNVSAALALSTEGDILSLAPWILGLIAIIGLGIVGAFFAKKEGGTKQKAEEFELVN